MKSEQACAIDQSHIERHLRTTYALQATLRRLSGVDSSLRSSYKEALDATHSEIIEILKPYAVAVLSIAQQTAETQKAYLNGEISQTALREVVLDTIQEDKARWAVEMLGMFGWSVERGRFGVMDVSLNFLSEIGEIEEAELVFIQGKGIWLKRSNADMLEIIYSRGRPDGLSVISLWKKYFEKTQLDDLEWDEFNEVRRDLFRLNVEGGENSIFVVRGTGREARFRIADGIRIKFPERKNRQPKSKLKTSEVTTEEST